MKLSELTTPCFVVDINKVRKNIKTMVKNCETVGVSLRPHTKTHKTVEIAVLQTEGRKRSITVSTLVEAEAYADAGFDDILFAYPITEEKIKRCIALIERLEQFVIMVSDVQGLKCLQENQHKLPDGKKWNVVIEIDPGYKRSGFVSNSEEFLNVADVVYSSMNLIALYSHCGGSYEVTSAKERTARHESATNALVGAKDRFRSKCKDKNAKIMVGTGSTPACSLFSECHKKLDEFHPGNYVFYDIEHYLLNACRQSDIAGRVMTRVVAHKPEEHMILIDCGFLGLSLHGIDRHPEDYGVFEGEFNLKVTGMSQEITKVKAKQGDLDCRIYPVGTILFILPFHSCSTAAMHQVYHVHDGDDVTDTWKPVKGW